MDDGSAFFSGAGVRTPESFVMTTKKWLACSPGVFVAGKGFESSQSAWPAVGVDVREFVLFHSLFVPLLSCFLSFSFRAKKTSERTQPDE